MYKNNWNRDLHGSGGTMIVHQNKIIVAERNSKLVMLEPEGGKLIWEQNVTSIHGWLTANGNRIYYLDEVRSLLIIDFTTGEFLNKLKFHYPYLGYVFVRKNFLITGSWRGYTDLMCYELNEKLRLKWKSERSGNLISYSLPILYKNLIILANNTIGVLYGIDMQTGLEIWAKSLPSEVGQLDRDFTIQRIDDNLFVYTKSGEICRFSLEDLAWEVVVKHTAGINSIRPQVLESQYIFQDIDGYICSYGRETNRLQWKFYSNHKLGNILAVELNEGTLLGGNMNKLRLIKNDGEILQEYAGVRRFRSGFNLINGNVFYIGKGSIVSMKIQK